MASEGGADSAAGSRQEAAERVPVGETSGGSGGLSISADDLEAEIELEADIDVDGKLGWVIRERGQVMHVAPPPASANHRSRWYFPAQLDMLALVLG